MEPVPEFANLVQQHLRRMDWDEFPDVVIHAEESRVKKHPRYAAAKIGDVFAAETLVQESIKIGAVDQIAAIFGDRRPHLLTVHALETEGMNVIPRVLAQALSKSLGLPVARGIIQINRVSHTGSSGYHRMAFPAFFAGLVMAREYFLVDDFIGQGGTLANLKGFVESCGAVAVGATTLTGKAYSAKLTLSLETLQTLRSKHGNELEQWWRATFGFGFERLTESEARYLVRSDDADAVTARIVAARRTGN
jgi:adenine/guanine phosphoribosyltransferase-like PRPP-binding protein